MLSTAHENSKVFEIMAKVVKIENLSRETLTNIWTSIASLVSKLSDLPVSLVDIVSMIFHLYIGSIIINW